MYAYPLAETLANICIFYSCANVNTISRASGPNYRLQLSLGIGASTPHELGETHR